MLRGLRSAETDNLAQVSFPQHRTPLLRTERQQPGPIRGAAGE